MKTKFIKTPRFRSNTKFIFGLLFVFSTILLIFYRNLNVGGNVMWMESSMESMKEMTFCEELYLGCFPIVGSNEAVLSSTQMTKTKCFETCSKSKKFYAGLEKGSTCICAPSMRQRGYTQLLSETDCGIPCSGDKMETCGGNKTIEWYRLKNPCVIGKDLPDSFGNSRLVGCYLDDLRNQTEIVFRNSAPTSCVLNCGLKGHPLALFDDLVSTCVCKRSLKPENWGHNFDLCENNLLMIYRTLSHDENCEPLHFLPRNSSVKRSALVSYPGSGNTWTRHMIEQTTGIYSGSVYGDRRLFNSGFLGEMPIVKDRTLVVKTHLFKNDLHKFDSVIFLIRNPYDAYVADFNRLRSSRKNHTGYASVEEFHKSFAPNVDHYSGGRVQWQTLFQYVLKSKMPFHLLLYEDLVQNPVFELRKVLKFFDEINNFKLSNPKTRLLCLSENLQGTQKRRKKQNQFDPYNENLKIKINAKIDNAQTLLTKSGLKVNISSYKKKLD